MGKRWNPLFESIKNIVIANLFKNILIGRFPLLHAHLGREESFKMRTDANKTTAGPVNANARAKSFS